MEEESIAICFTQGHGEKLVIEEVQHEGLVDMLFKSGYRLGKIETWVSWQKLLDYQILVIGCPRDEEFREDEIAAIVDFVNEGGSLFFLADEGGDRFSMSNMNEITRNFGFSFKSNTLKDEVNYSHKPEYMKISNYQRHFITRDLKEIIFASGCSINVEDKKKVLELARSGSTSESKTYDKKWLEYEKAPNEVIMVVSRHGKGKVVALGNFSIITSLSSKYGLYAFDNFALIGNIFAWLSNKKLEDVDKSGDVYVNISLDSEIYFWIERELKKGRFGNINELVAFALNAVKQSLAEMDDVNDEGTDEEGVITEVEGGSPAKDVKKLEETDELEPAKKSSKLKKEPKKKEPSQKSSSKVISKKKHNISSKKASAASSGKKASAASSGKKASAASSGKKASMSKNAPEKKGDE
ncbi:MAG: Gldg family protein [Promethearchaeota archaeon]